MRLPHPLSVIDRYVLREFAVSTLAIVTVLLVLFTGTTLANIVDEVASGQMAGTVVLTVLALHLVSTLQTTLPMGMFLGMLLALGRMYRDNEMAVLAASGLGPKGLLVPAAVMGIATAAAVGMVSLWAGPLAVRVSHQQIERANRSVIALGLEPDQFTDLTGRNGILLASTVNRTGTRLGRLFVESEQTGKNGVTHLSVVTARHGALAAGSRQGGTRFITLHDGYRYDIPLGHNNWRVMQFARSEVALASPSPASTDRPDNQRTTTSLMHDRSPAAKAELQWRIAIPASVLVFAMLALPLARQRPRASTAGRLLTGTLAYLIITNLSIVTRIYIASGKLAAGVGMWWILAPVFAAAVWVFTGQYAVHRRNRTVVPTATP